MRGRRPVSRTASSCVGGLRFDAPCRDEMQKPTGITGESAGFDHEMADCSHEELAARVAALEEALDRIHRECENALESPQLVTLTVCRVASVARRALSMCDEAAE